MTVTTQLIEDGEDQIVLIPVEFAFSGEFVSIRRDGDAVILEPFEDDRDGSAPGRS